MSVIKGLRNRENIQSPKTSCSMESQCENGGLIFRKPWLFPCTVIDSPWNSWNSFSSLSLWWYEHTWQVTWFQNRISLEQLTVNGWISKSKGKVDPVHAMKAYRGSRCIGKYNCLLVMHDSVPWDGCISQTVKMKGLESGTIQQPESHIRVTAESI
jgi:hypothetical protein